MDKCPTCEREFLSFRDYPKVYIEKFEKKDIDSLAKFPSENGRYDKRRIIERHLNPFLNNLEKLVGQEVPTSKLIPFGGSEQHRDYEIPDTSRFYYLTFERYSGKKEVELQITNIRGASWKTKDKLAVVGILYCEGRINSK